MATKNGSGDDSRSRRGRWWPIDGWLGRQHFVAPHSASASNPLCRYDHIGFRVVLVPVDARAPLRRD